MSTHVPNRARGFAKGLAELSKEWGIVVMGDNNSPVYLDEAYDLRGFQECEYVVDYPKNITFGGGGRITMSVEKLVFNDGEKVIENGEWENQR